MELTSPRPPDPSDTDAICRIVGPLQGGARWSEWATTLPLVPKIDEKARLQPLDNEIRLLLPHLQQVCHKPRLHLRVEEERLPVARARRVPARAASSLVSHPEDWEHRTLRSIRPTRVLATQIEDEWNLYENRVSARLVDHLLAWVQDRLDVLYRLKQMVKDSSDFRDEIRGSRWRGRRLYELWGRFFTDNALEEQLAHTLKVMERLRRDLQALLGSPLYREVPPETFVPVALRPTNILVNDPHYRKVAALWRAWARHGHTGQPTREELQRRREAERRNFNAFALLIVVQALEGLGYRPPEGVEIPGAGEIELDGPLKPVRLRVSEGTIRLETRSASLEIASVLSPVGRDRAGELWRQIQWESADRPDDKVVLLLGRATDLAGVDPATESAFAGWEYPRVVLISPWSLDCVERIARVIRQWESRHRFKDYPPRAQVRLEPEIKLPDWMRRAQGFVAVVSPASAEQQRAFVRDCELRMVAQKREQAEAQRARRTFDPGRIEALETLARLAERAPELAGWDACPVCGRRSGNRFEPRPGDDGAWERWAWWCRCGDCSSQWGLRVCGACRHSFPVLVPDVQRGSRDERREGAGWIDRWYGRDVWAEPCGRSDSSGAFRCTRCRRCPSSGCASCDTRGQGA